MEPARYFHSRFSMPRAATRAASAVALLVIALVGAACVPETEEGWIPGPNGAPIWATYELRGDVAVIDGDMHFDLVELRDYQQRALARATIQHENAWPDGVVIYDDDTVKAFSNVCANADCSTTQEDEIREAMAIWERQTDVRFQAKTGNEHHIVFVKDVSTCSSDVGYTPGWSNSGATGSKQTIKVRMSCRVGSIAHELGHAMGLWHEQSREDRSSYITVYRDNFTGTDDSWEVNYGIHGQKWGDYNYRSIMHYSGTGSAKPSTRIFEPVLDVPYSVIGYRPGFGGLVTKGDAAAIDDMVVRGITGQAGDPGGVRSLFIDAGIFPDVGTRAAEFQLGYVDDDPFIDLVGFRKDLGTGGEIGDVLYAPGIGDGTFGATQLVHPGICEGYDDSCVLSDMNGDGFDDVVVYDPDGERIMVALNQGGSFGALELWQYARLIRRADMRVGDINGDCRNDVVIFEWNGVAGTVQIFVGLSTGSAISPLESYGTFDAVDVAGISDLNADGSEDIVLVQADGDVALHAAPIGIQSGFDSAHIWAPAACPAGRRCVLVDMDGDDMDDLVVEYIPDPFIARHPLERLRVMVNLGDHFTTEAEGYGHYHELNCRAQDRCLYADLDNDGLTDIVEPGTTRMADTPGTLVYTSLSTGIWPTEDWIASGSSNEWTYKTDLRSPGCSYAPPPTSSGPWEQMTTWPVAEVVGTRFQPYAVSAVDGDLYRHVDAMSWELSADDAYKVAASDDWILKRHMIYYGTYRPVVSYSSDGVVWGGLGLDMPNVWAGGSGVVGIGYDNHLRIYGCVCGGYTLPGWTDIGYLSPANLQVDVGGRYPDPWDDATVIHSLYRLDSAGVHSFNYYTMTWSQIGGPAGKIWAGGDKLYATNPTTGNLYAFDVRTRQWRYVSGPGADFAIDEQSGALLKLSANKDSVWLLSESDTWIKIGGPADRVWAASRYAWATSRVDGSLWRLPLD